MEDKIKEILDKLKDKNNYISHSMILLSIKETTAILDYITNLQQENVRLKDTLNKIMVSDGETTPVLDLINENEKLNCIIEKATEILKDKNVDMPSTLLIETIDYGINILRGEDNEC